MRSSARLGFALLLAARSAIAQVGHDPAHSPYRSLRYGQFISFTAGYFNGDGGGLGAAPHRGAPSDRRYAFLAPGTATVGPAAAYGDLQRQIITPHKPIETAVTGPVK